MTEQILIAVAILVFLVVGFWTKNNHVSTIGNFSTKRDSLSWFVTSAGVSMTFVGGAALINMASLGYSFSWYTLVDPIALIIGIVISIIFIRKYREDKGVTISQLLSSDNKTLSIYIGIISSIIFLLITAAQFVAFSKLLSPYFPDINPQILILIPSAIILMYVFGGGFSAVTNTDVLQLIFLFLFLIIPVGYFFITNSTYIETINHPRHDFATMPLELIILLSISILFIPTSQDINVRVKSAKNKKQALLGLIFGGIFYSIIVISCSYIGIVLAKNGVMLNDTEQAFSMFFKQYYPQFGIFAVLAGMAAIWSTLDTYLVNGITSIAQDLLKKNASFNRLSERKLILISGVLVYAISMLAGLYFNEVLSLILTSLLIYISVIIPIAFAKWQNIRQSYIFPISLLTVFILIMLDYYDIYPSYKAILFPSLGIVLMYTGKLISKLS